MVLLVSPTIVGQVGINNTNPKGSAALDIFSSNKGVLIPRVELISTTDIVTIENAANSLLVYNTATNNDVYPGFYYWDISYPKWVRWIAKGFKKSVKYSITDTSTNLNTNANSSTGAVIPVFGSLEWNDDTNLYVQSGNQMTVTRSGKYQVVVHAYIKKTNSTDYGVAPEMQVLVNGTRRGTMAIAKNMSDGSHSYSSILLLDTFQLNANDIIQIDSKAAGLDTYGAYFVAGTPANGYPSNITITYKGL
jgi:hypothetical protein